MNIKSLAAGLALCVTAVCADAFILESKNTDIFPLGIYGVTEPEEVAVVKAAGFNTVQTYSGNPEVIAALAKACRQQNMKLLAYPDKIVPSKYFLESSDWPILAWYLFDEPDVVGLDPAQLLEKDLVTKRNFPGQHTVFVVGEGLAALKYGKSADIVMMDWYPVPHLKLESVGKQVGITRNMLQTLDLKDKPVWAVLQAFDWKDYPQRSKKRIGRFPEAYEIRFMTYDALINGARGLFYFTFKARDNDELPYYPEKWQALTDTVGEIKELLPVLENGTPEKCPVPLANLEAKAWLYKGKTYLILANPTENNILIPEPFPDSAKWEPLFERSSDLADLVPERKTPYMKPYRVFVFKSR